MNRLFAASLLVALAAIQLTAPLGVAGESVLAGDPTRGQDTFAFESNWIGLGRQLKKGKKGGDKGSKFPKGSKNPKGSKAPQQKTSKSPKGSGAPKAPKMKKGFKGGSKVPKSSSAPGSF